MNKNNLSLVQSQILNNSRMADSGFSLIEVLISAVVLSVSLLGLSAMQVTALKGTHHSYMKQKATNIIQDMIERMRVNSTAAKTSLYSFDSQNLSCTATTSSCLSSGCTPAQIAAYDKKIVVCGNVKLSSTGQIPALSSGRMIISCQNANVASGVLAACASGDVILELKWQERAMGTNDSPKQRSMKIHTRIR